MVGGSGMTDVIGRFAHTTPIALSCCVPSPVIPADAGTHGRGPGNDGGISLRPPQPWVPAFAGMTEGGGLSGFERGAEVGVLEWVIPSKTLQIVSLRRFTLPLDRAPAALPSYPSLLPSLLPSPRHPGGRRDPWSRTG